MSLLEDRPQRFAELKRDVGDVTQKSLTSVLRELEKNGIAERIVPPTVPPRVDFDLIPLGRSLLVPIKALRIWTMDNHPCVVDARSRYEENAAVQIVLSGASRPMRRRARMDRET